MEGVIILPCKQPIVNLNRWLLFEGSNRFNTGHFASHLGWAEYPQRRRVREKLRALTNVYVDFLHPGVNHGILARASRRSALVKEILSTSGWRARSYRVAMMVWLRERGWMSGWGEDVTPRRHHHRGLPRTLARSVRRVGAARPLVVDRLMLKRWLLPLGAIIVRRVAG